MKHRRMIALAAALASPFFFAAGGGQKKRVQADKLHHYYEGMYASGAIVRETNCPVVIEKQSLTLNVSSLPSVAENGNLACSAGEAEITYLFYNPQDDAYKMTLLSPYGLYPSYVKSDAEELPFYSYVGEMPVSGNIRYTYAMRDFRIHEDSERVCEEKRTGFCSPDSVVTQYTYSLQTPDADGNYSLQLKFPVNSFKSRVLFEKADNARLNLEDGNTLFKIKLDGSAREKQVVFYVAGEPVTVQSAALFHDKTQVNYTVEEPAIDTLTFETLAMKNYPASGDVGETDWYNAFIDMLEERTDANGSALGITLQPEFLMRWFEYEITVPAKGYVENTVKVPVYPTIEGAKNFRYEYAFLLSAAGKWADVKQVEIKINTPYYLTHSSLDFPEPRMENGMYSYALTRDYLPQGELTFGLAETEGASTDYDYLGHKNFSALPWNWAFITLIALMAIAGGIAVTVVIFLRVKKKK